MKILFIIAVTMSDCVAPSLNVPSDAVVASATLSPSEILLGSDTAIPVTTPSAANEVLVSRTPKNALALFGSTGGKVFYALEIAANEDSPTPLLLAAGTSELWVQKGISGVGNMFVTLTFSVHP